MTSPTTNPSGARGFAVFIFVFALAFVLSASIAKAVVSTYRWQISNGQTYGGRTTDWSEACGSRPTVTAERTTTMTTAAFGCTDDRLYTTEAGATFNWLLMMNPNAYGQASLVTGQATGNIFRLRNNDGAGTFSVAIHLGYVTGGAFTSFGSVAINSINTATTTYNPDMSSISGTAPSGSFLAARVVVTSNTSGNEVRMYLGSANSDGGTLSIDETAACVPTGSLSILAGQSLSGNPIDLTSIATTTNASNLLYEVWDGACPVATFSQTDDFLGEASCGTGPGFGNWTAQTGSDGQQPWRGNSGSTASGNTGPTIGNPDPYVYLEASSAGVHCNAAGVSGGATHSFESNVIDASLYALSFTFDWHLWTNGVNGNASLHLDAWNGASWDSDVTGSAIQTGDGGTAWYTTGPVDLSAYTNADFKVRLRYIVGTQSVYQNDVAFDNLVFSGGPSQIFSGSDVAAQTADTTAWTAGDKCLQISGDDAICGTPLTTATETFNFVSRLLTLGDGVDPGDGSLCPGDGATALDAFTMVVNNGSATVSQVELTLAAGSSAGLSLVEITDDAGGTVYGSVANPVADTFFVSLGSSIPVTTTATQYRVRVTPKSHAAMPSPPGSTYAVTGIVTDLTIAGAGLGGSDTNSATLTIDNTSPGNAAWGAVTAGDGQVDLAWANPGNADFASVIILRSTAAISDTPTEGQSYVAGNTIGASTVVYSGGATAFSDTSVTNGTAYYYKIFARDNCGNYATGSQTGPHTPSAPALEVTPGVPSATVDGCNQITVVAPYSGDSPVSNSTTTFRRGSSATGPWAAVCSGIAGASPRNCVDAGVLESSNYWYQVEFFDADGVLGTNPQVIGPFVTPACGQDDTTVTSNSALITSCRQITTTTVFLGDDNGNGSTLVEYNTSNTWPGTNACTVVGASPRQCLVTNLSPSTTYWVRLTTSDPDGVSGPAQQILGSYTLPACTADQVAPTLLFGAPTAGALLGDIDRVQVQVYDATGSLAASNAVQWNVDGGAWTTTTTINANYDCNDSEEPGTCWIYEFDIDTTAYTNGAHYFEVRAEDAAGNIATRTVPVVVNNSGGRAAGSGTLLRRTESSQLCISCHNLQTHSSQYTDTKYGNWAVDCVTCHRPHGDTNIYLIRDQIQTPNSGTNTVNLRQDDRAGGGMPNFSYLGDTSGAGNQPYDDGICETCHTKTNHYRNDASGGDHTHNQNTRCIGCHVHGKGFSASESKGCTVEPISWSQCNTCHPQTWNGMTGGAKTSVHTLGGTQGTNDSCYDTNITWGPILETNVVAARSCVNMCHQDHTHNQVGGSDHANNVHRDATTQATRSVGRNVLGDITSGTPDNTDFSNTGNGGMCISCHQFPVESAAAPDHPALSQAEYAGAAHDRTSTNPGGVWAFTQHDGTSFTRNCTKCHSDRADSQPSDSGTPFGAVHYSDYPNLLAGATNPAGNAGNDFICYNCHGNGTTGVDYSGKDLATVIATKTYTHPVDADADHDSFGVASEAVATHANGAFSGAKQHVNCIDCHNPHEAGTAKHVQGTNTIAANSVLNGATGVSFTAPGTNFAATGSGDFSTNPVRATREYEVCFKCHSSFGFGNTPPTAPTLTAITPARVGNNAGATVTLDGSFDRIQRIDVGTMSITSFTQVSATRLTFTMPAPAEIGNALAVTVTNAAGTSNALAIRVDGTHPMRLGGIAVGVRSFPFIVDAVGDTGWDALLFLSTSNRPSVLPGIVSLGIADNFMLLFQAGAASLDLHGSASFPVTLPNTVPGGMYYFQAITYDPTNITVPLEVSNVFAVNFF